MTSGNTSAQQPFPADPGNTAAANGEQAPEAKTTLAAELWYRADPGVFSEELRNRLTAEFPGATFSQGVALLPHADHSFDINGSSGAQTVHLSTGVAVPGGTMTSAEALQATPTDQSWSWPDAGQEVPGCSHRILVTEVVASGFEPKPRVESFHRVLRLLAEATKPAAIRWLHNSHWRDPGELEAAHPLAGPVNMRFFLVSNDEGAMVVDSLGMYQLGLPDVQVHFRGVDPNVLVELAFNVAAYLYEHGPVIQSKAQLNGPEGMKFTATWEDSLLPPLRTVIDLDPGTPYSAGNR
ncbi:DUF4261 domain-containing protein [Arthrobacter sulfonylureivorans]|uniref:DUF4261 domain-containing protein n=1 Tax=Arthrobacter sulfonylureivorans TaxID=2486855 RepID=UPI0039E5AEC4